MLPLRDISSTELTLVEKGNAAHVHVPDPVKLAVTVNDDRVRIVTWGALKYRGYFGTLAYRMLTTLPNAAWMLQPD
jgi:hypothetical protein